jgi:hypothetical protein
MTWLTVIEYLCHKWTRICSTCRKHFPVLSSFTTYYRVCNWLTRRVPLVEHMSSPPVFSGVRFTRSLVLYVCFVDRCLSFCTFSFGHCVVCSSSIYGFWLPLWYLQTHLDIIVYLFFPHLTKSQGERLILLCVRPLKPLIAFLHFNIFLRNEMIIEWFHSKLYPIGPPLLKIENV